MISIIIPAHNESAVLARTLTGLTLGAEPGEMDIVVVCNGCTDNTAAIARAFGGPVRVIETQTASKAHALNLGDQASLGFPRVYVDADVVLTAEATRHLVRRLEGGKVLAVAPTPEFVVDDCSWLVRRFFRVRSCLPSSREGIGGSGVYGLSEAGRSRFGLFPTLTADDGYVRVQFQPGERETLPEVKSRVFPPRTIRDLIAQKTRTHYGSFELQERFPALWQNSGESNGRSLLRLFKRPYMWCDLAIYVFVMVTARRRAHQRLRKRISHWERDNTSRVAA